MARQRTLVLCKPDSVQRGMVGRIISRFEQKGLKIVGLKMMKIDKDLASKHYPVSYTHLTLPTICSV